jgi:hypothetical protein
VSSTQFAVKPARALAAYRKKTTSEATEEDRLRAAKVTLGRGPVGNFFCPSPVSPTRPSSAHRRIPKFQSGDTSHAQAVCNAFCMRWREVYAYHKPRIKKRGWTGQHRTTGRCTMQRPAPVKAEAAARPSQGGSTGSDPPQSRPKQSRRKQRGERLQAQAIPQ